MAAGIAPIRPSPLQQPCSLETYRICLRPDGASSPDTHLEGGEESIAICAGAVEVELSGARYLLHTGDTLHFSADVPQRHHNPFSEPVLLPLVLSYRSAYERPSPFAQNLSSVDSEERFFHPIHRLYRRFRPCAREGLPLNTDPSGAARGIPGFRPRGPPPGGPQRGSLPPPAPPFGPRLRHPPPHCARNRKTHPPAPPR